MKKISAPGEISEWYEEAVRLAQTAYRIHGFDKIHRIWVDVTGVDALEWWGQPMHNTDVEVLLMLQYQYREYRTARVSATQAVVDDSSVSVAPGTVGAAVEAGIRLILHRNPDPISLDVRYIVENGTVVGQPHIYGLRFGGW